MKYVKTKSFAFLWSLFAFALNGRALASHEPRIESLSLAGSGCPVTKDAHYSLQGEFLLISFPGALKAEVGPGVTLSSLRKNCSATIVFADDGKSLAVQSVGWYGTADLEAGQDANLNVSWFYQGQGKTGTYSAVLQGAGGSQPWLNNFEDSLNQYIWEPCHASRALTINTSLRISGPRDLPAKSQLFILGVRLKSRSC